ncbi:MAG: DNA-binding domain-containing protein [Steroidobacter sp.]
MAHSWAETQAAFAVAMTDSSLPPPQGVIECGGSRRRAGFAVYRNNSVVGLIDALQERFPVTRRLVGDDFFRAMARSYVSEHRPCSPLLMYYGDELPTFIDDFAPANDVSYLSDVARLEIAWSQAYHAPEEASLQAQVLADAPPDVLLDMRLTLHASARLLRSVYPIVDIWAAHQGAGEVTPPARWIPQDILIVRPDGQVRVQTLGPGVYAFVDALLDRMCVQRATEIALLDNAEFDVGRSIVDLFGVGAVVALVDDNQEKNE